MIWITVGVAALALFLFVGYVALVIAGAPWKD